MTQKTQKPTTDFADKLTGWIGTKTSLLVHTFLFMSIFSLRFFNVSMDQILLILTTSLSIEAIYLAIFIQITVNKNTQSLEEVEHDIDEIQEDVIEEDIHDKEVEETLNSIEERLNTLQKDLEVLRKKGLA
jgi:hypothetical protein